jgi:hypothetical protein
MEDHEAVEKTYYHSILVIKNKGSFAPAHDLIRHVDAASSALVSYTRVTLQAVMQKDAAEKAADMMKQSAKQ